MDPLPSPSELLASRKPLVLEACDPARNQARSWRLSIDSDLFGWTLVEWSWGRIGSPGQSRSAAFASADEAYPLLSRLLARRMTAPRRIGSTYRQAAC